MSAALATAARHFLLGRPRGPLAGGLRAAAGEAGPARGIPPLPRIAPDPGTGCKHLVVERAEQLRGLERDWKRLWRRTQPANPFLSWEWQGAWAEHHRLRPLVVAEMAPDGSLAGLLALQRVRRRGLRQVEFLGQGSGGDDLDCLLHPQAGGEVAARLLATALGRAKWDVLRLEGMRPGGSLEAALEAQGGAGNDVRRCATAGEWLPYLRLPRSFEELLAGRSANFRSEVRRRRRALERLAPGLRVECAQTATEVAGAMQHLYRLHNLRREQKQGKGIFERAELRNFHRQVAARLAAGGATRLYLLRTPGAVVAALYGFEAGGRFYYFQSGLDPAWTGSSVGTVLLSAVVEDCIARGLRQFEFLRGDESYKARWATERRRGRNWQQAGSVRGRAYERLRAWARPRLAPGERSAAEAGATEFRERGGNGGGNKPEAGGGSGAVAA